MEMKISIITIMLSLSQSEDAYNCSAPNVFTSGIVRTFEPPSIPTDWALNLPEHKICDCGSPDSVMTLLDDLLESSNEDEEDDDSVVILYEDLLESRNEDEEDDPNVIYIADDPPFRESYASKINKKLVLSEEFNIYDNISQGSNACNSSAQYVCSSVEPEFVCIMHPSAQYVCSSGIDTEFEKPCIPTSMPENLPRVCVSCTLLGSPIGP